MCTKIKRVIIFAIIVFFSLSFAEAQDIFPVSTSNIGVANVQVIKQEGSALEISFDLASKQKSPFQVRYEVMIAQGSEQNFKIIESREFDETITLQGEQIITKKISYSAPALLDGTYRIYLKFIDEKKTILATSFVGEVKLKNSNQSIGIDYASCYLTVENDKEQKKYTPQEGVEVGTKENLQIHCILENRNSGKAVIIPNITTYSRVVLDRGPGFGELEPVSSEPAQKSEKIATKNLEVITLEPSQQIEKTFVIPKESALQAYTAVLSFFNDKGKAISLGVNFNYAVGQAKPSIQNIVFDKDSYKKGETARISFSYSPGAGDEIGLDLLVSLKDENGNSCFSPVEKQLTEKDAGSINLEIVVESDCNNFRAKVDIKNKGENEWTQVFIDKQSFGGAGEKKEEPKNNTVRNVILIFAILVLVVLLVGYFIKRKVDVKKMPVVLFFFIFLSAGILMGGAALAGCQIPNTSRIVSSGQSSGLSHLESGYWWNMNATCNSNGTWSHSMSGGWAHYTQFGCGFNAGNGSCGALVFGGPDYYMNYFAQSSTGAMYWDGLYMDWYTPPPTCHYYYPEGCYSDSCREQSCSPSEPVYAVLGAGGYLSCPDGFMVYERFSGYGVGSIFGNCSLYDTAMDRCLPRCISFSASQMCADSSWSPDPATVPSGQSFTQTSNCGTTRSSTGTNIPPAATNLSVSQANYCSAGPAAIFSWTFSGPEAGETQSAYQIQVATNAGFSGPGTVLDTGKVSSASNSYATVQGILSYNQSYYWRVMVWDNLNQSSNWADYNNPADPDGDGGAKTFTTPKHQFPTANFSWAPINPSANEDTQFADQSTVYGGATKASWSWAFQDGLPSSSSQQNPMIKFLSAGAKQVIMQITDSDSYFCSLTKTVGARLALPNWREIAP